MLFELAPSEVRGATWGLVSGFGAIGGLLLPLFYHSPNSEGNSFVVTLTILGLLGLMIGLAAKDTKEIKDRYI